jgi:hypothetical protein
VLGLLQLQILLVARLDAFDEGGHAVFDDMPFAPGIFQVTLGCV